MRPKIDMKDKIIKVKDCDMWTAGCHKQNYPMMRDPHVKGRMVIVVRWLAEQKLGKKLTRQTRVKNNCGNVKCVNLDHYDIVDYDTDIDRWKCTPHFISPEIREKMRDEYNSTPKYHGFKTYLVKKYRVTPCTLNKILAGN